MDLGGLVLGFQHNEALVDEHHHIETIHDLMSQPQIDHRTHLLTFTY